MDALRGYMEDYCGSALFSGFPAAIIDLVDIEGMSGEQLCRKAEELGIDLRPFAIEE